MRAIFNKSLLFNYLDDQQTKASTNQLRFTASEKRALVNIVREAVTNGDISSAGSMRAISGSSAPVDESAKSAGSAHEGKSKPSFGDLFELALRQVAQEDSPVGPKAPGVEVTPSSTSGSIFDESFIDSSTTAALADAQVGSVTAAVKPLPEMPRQLFVPREDEEADVPPAPDESAAGGCPADFVSQFGSGVGPAAAAVENVIEIGKSRSDFLTPVGRALGRWATTRARREQRDPRADVKMPPRSVSFAYVLIDKAITTRDGQSSCASGHIQQDQPGDSKLEEAAQPVRLRHEQLFARKEHKCLERKRSGDRERESGSPSRNRKRLQLCLVDSTV